MGGGGEGEVAIKFILFSLSLEIGGEKNVCIDSVVLSLAHFTRNSQLKKSYNTT